MTLGGSALAAGFVPLTHPVEELPAGVGKVFWANESLAGTSDGVFQLKDGVWEHFLSGREVQALGELPGGGWWAAGAGFVATSTGALLAHEEDFTSGCAGREGVFLAGKQGVWLLHESRLTLVHPNTSPLRLRVFRVGEQICLFTAGHVLVWGAGKFTPQAPWEQLSFYDLIAIHSDSRGPQLLAYEGLFSLEAGRPRPIYSEGFRDLLAKGTVGFHVGEHEAVVAAFFAGARAVSDSNRVIWELGVKELGGNPYSLLKTKDGFLLGTSSGAVRVFSEAFSRLPLPGEYVFTVDDKVRLPSGAFDLKTGIFTPKAPTVENNGATGYWGFVTLPDHRRIDLPGREIIALAPYRSGWMVLQDAVLTVLDMAGNILERIPVVGANSALVDGDAAWVGTAAGLYRFDGQKLTAVTTGSPVRVQRGENSPVFVAENRIRRPDNTEYRLPGRVLAVDLGYAALQVGAETFVGRYTGGEWQPLDTPRLPAGVSHLRQEGNLLYVVSPQEVVRIDLAKTAPLALPAPHTRTERVDLPLFTARLPAPRPAPWPSPRYAVKANGDSVPVADGVYAIPRLPYGTTTVEVTAMLGGLAAREQVTLVRPRPWWLDWPGGVLYLLALSGGVMGLVRWRTHRLTLRARELQLKVDERTRELHAALQARELFFSSVSHEIRNPLNGVVGLCDMLNEASVGARERLLVKTLKSCSDQLRRILDDVLDFSRIDRGELEFHLEVFDLGPAIEGAARAVDPTLARVQLFAPPGTWVEGDVGKLRQVVTNLVSNALKYGQPPLARVEVIHQAEPDGYVALEVRVVNSGPDLPAAEQQSIFSGFHRGEDARRRRLPGSGLGLSLSRRLMRAMRGDLTVTSAGGLTTFLLTLRLRPAAPPDEAAAPQAPLRLSKALAIEDEHYNRLVLGHILGQLGYEVDWAVDGASALEALKTGTYDLILTDYMLPDMDGVELARQLLASAAPPAPPVVMVTAYSTREKQDAAHAAGISGFVTKPVTAKKLQAALLGLGYGMRGRRSLDLVRPSGRFDFAVFHRMNDGRAALGQFADQFEEAFQALLGLVEKPEPLRKAAHALRGRATVVHAATLAEQLGVIEELAAAGDRDGVTRVLSVLEPMVHDLAETARHHVFSSSDFGKALG